MRFPGPFVGDFRHWDLSEVQGVQVSGISFSFSYYILTDRHCGLVLRVSGYRYRGLGFDSRRYQIF